MAGANVKRVGVGTPERRLAGFTERSGILPPGGIAVERSAPLGQPAVGLAEQGCGLIPADAGVGDRDPVG